MVLDAFAPEVREHPFYVDMWEGVCLGLLDLACPEGALDTEVSDDRTRIEARFSG